ncbi:MAG: hypothetical protein IT385_30420 [Deltaproteobacteria bacterium]|nr:hypothetical protein [Deltaproteobacteria bacterium]
MGQVDKHEQHHPTALTVKIRSLPKVIFFYPVWIFSLVCALIAAAGEPPAAWLGMAWMSLFILNLFVISFDFTEQRTVIVVLTVVVAILALVLLGALSDVTAFMTALRPQMNQTFYWMMFVTFSVIFLLAWLGSRLDYWQIEPNEIVHRYGFFRRMKRFSTESLRWDKLIPDVMERIMLGTGTIILTTPYEKHPIVIEHVMRIGSVDDQIARILGVKQVVEGKRDHLPTDEH